MTTRNRQRGSAMLVTLILIAALLAGVAVLVSLQLTTTKSTELTRNGLAALHCAEAGLAVSHREIVKPTHTTDLVNHLTTNPYPAMVQPAFLTTYFATGSPYNMSDVDQDGTAGDFQVYIVDDDDDTGTQLYNDDNNSRYWLISKCTRWPDSPKEVRELVEFPGTPTRYEWQDGRSFGNNNANAIN